jgi:hypothetical protein
MLLAVDVIVFGNGSSIVLLINNGEIVYTAAGIDL